MGEIAQWECFEHKQRWVEKGMPLLKAMASFKFKGQATKKAGNLIKGLSALISLEVGLHQFIHSPQLLAGNGVSPVFAQGILPKWFKEHSYINHFFELVIR